MKKRMLATLARVNPRLLLGLMILIVGLVIFEGWLLLQQPMAEYQKLKSSRELMSLSISSVPSQQGELSLLVAELRQVSARLTGQFRSPQPDSQIAALVMAELDHSAEQFGVTLSGIRPGPHRAVLSFEETSFEVRAQGNYLKLCQWLMDFERTLGHSATISEVTMKAAGDGRVILLNLKLGLYRPLNFPGVTR
jgi:Tfp pilus assembly protein PilO